MRAEFTGSPLKQTVPGTAYIMHDAGKNGFLNCQELYPRLKKWSGLEPSLHTAIKAGDNKFYSDRVFASDSNFLKVFDVGIIGGDPATTLKEPFSAIISESLARKML